MSLVVHVIPTALARGAQVYARALADELDGPGTRHIVLCLFDGESDVGVDQWLGCSGGDSAGEGFDPRVVLRLRSALRRLAPSAVVAHGGDALKYAVWGRGTAPLVYYAIGTLSEGARHGLRRTAWRYMAGRAAVVAAVSADVARECRSVLHLSSERVEVIPNGRDPALFHPLDRGAHAELAGDDTTPVVIFVGRMTAGKRPDVFVRLVRELRSRGVKLRALAVGDGPMHAELEAIAAEASVELVGASDDVCTVLRHADLLVFPSDPEGEGMPGVLIEAGLSGVPVIATAVAGVHDVVDDGVTGVVVGVGDFDALVKAATGLLADPRGRSAMGAAARARCERLFSVQASATRWQELLDRIVSATPESPGLTA